ncbi:TetR family transcriptional regulator [Streptomyces sodiiphilus]|uniref:TetR family transcriptional regulator n=1 Tax=Streptomyces sodiiphilus TaxID=226217 RepID=A0ABN2P086_9ACTN
MENTGLRERKKAETRQAVHEAALRLAVEHGFDHVTVEAIADAANISRRTFSNYFASKEDALLHGDLTNIRTLARLVRERPAGEPPWQAMHAAVHDLNRAIGEPEREWAIRARLAKRHPSVLARQLANFASLESELAQFIAERGTGEDAAGDRPRVMAAAFMTALRLAGHLWTADDETRSLAAVTDDVLDQMSRPFT